METIYVAALSAADDDPMIACEKAYVQADSYLKDYQEEAEEHHRTPKHEIIPQMAVTTAIDPSGALRYNYCYTITIITTDKMRRALLSARPQQGDDNA